MWSEVRALTAKSSLQQTGKVCVKPQEKQSPHILAMVQLILLLPDPRHVQSQVMPSLYLSNVSPTV